MEEKKNKTYAGQVADIARKDVHLSLIHISRYRKDTVYPMAKS